MLRNFFWINRRTLQEIGATPDDMARKFGGVFEVGTDRHKQPASNTDWINAPDLSFVEGWPKRYWYNPQGDDIRLYDSSTRAAIDFSETRRERDDIASRLHNIGDLTRALVLLILDEFNRHTERTNDMLDALGNATSLQDLQTRIGQIQKLPVRDPADLFDAVRQKLDQ